MLRSLLGMCAVLLSAPVNAAEWSWTWPAAPGEMAPQVEVCHFLYGKQWAYAIEIDDGPTCMTSVIQPMLAKHHFTDAPPGIPGGRPLQFVAGAAIVVQSVGTANDTLLQWDQLRALQAQGWDVVNHSYFHAGHSWDPPEILTPAQIQRDLFWSQTVIAAETGNGRAPTHFVYPNGYLDYRKYLPEFGLRSGTHVAGEPANWALYSSTKPDLYNLQRAYLDEAPWAGDWGKSDVMFWFPKDGPKPDTMFIDFTHGIENKPTSPHYQLWEKRLTTISQRYGAGNADNMWSATTGEILDYVGAAKAAKVQASVGRISIQLPDSLPGSRLTLRISGTKAPAIAPPPGAIVYRRDSTLWLTTPMIGKPRSPAPDPQVQRIYSGPVKDMKWDQPIAFAGIRMLQCATPTAKDYVFSATATTPDGSAVALVPPDEGKLDGAWNRWRLYSIVPNAKPVMATRLHVSADPAFCKMEVWAVR